MRRPDRWTLVGMLLVMLAVANNLDWGNERWKGTLEADAKGYYAYLPAVFIYHDLNFGFFDHIEKEKYYDPNLFYDYRTKVNGRSITKYYCGTAAAQMPFFLIAHGIALLTDHDADGYSMPYGIALNFAALFWLFLGLYFLNRLLALFEVSASIRAVVLAATLFGTNLFYYSAGELGMSHVYSFGAISVWAFHVARLGRERRSSDLYVIGVLLGIIVLIRPVNLLVVLFVPFLVSSWSALKDVWKWTLHHTTTVTISTLLALLVISVQPIIYYISAGKFIIYAYGDEGFNFLDPHIIDFLFSYKKGLFLYTPIYLLAIIGTIALHKRSKYQTLTFSVATAVVIYVLASWWMWFYGGSFSSRPMVDYLPFIMVPLAVWLSDVRKKLRPVLVGTVVLLIALCQIQTYQYRYYQIHWVDMTKEKYWDVFLRIDRSAER